MKPGVTILTPEMVLVYTLQLYFWSMTSLSGKIKYVLHDKYVTHVLHQSVRFLICSLMCLCA